MFLGVISLIASIVSSLRCIKTFDSGLIYKWEILNRGMKKLNKSDDDINSDTY